MSVKAKVILGVLGILVLVGGLIVGIILVRQRQELRKKAAPATTLSIIPSSQSKIPGQTVNFSVLMDSGENLVTGFDIDLSFNPAAFEISSIQQGSGVASFDQVIRNNIDNTGGVINYSSFTLDKTKAVQGATVEVLRITGKVKDGATAGTYTISFGPATAVSGVAEGQNVLTGTTPSTVVVLAASGSSPTPTPTQSPTPTPTPTPSEVGGGEATPTSTPTPTPVQTLPDAGVSYPTILGIGLGLLLLIGSLLLVI